jgi:hypothetical protein
LAFGNSRWLGHSLAIWEFALALALGRVIWEFGRTLAPTQAEKTPEKKYRKNTSPIPSCQPERFLSDS